MNLMDYGTQRRLFSISKILDNPVHTNCENILKHSFSIWAELVLRLAIYLGKIFSPLIEMQSDSKWRSKRGKLSSPWKWLHNPLIYMTSFIFICFQQNPILGLLTKHIVIIYCWMRNVLDFQQTPGMTDAEFYI